MEQANPEGSLSAAALRRAALLEMLSETSKGQDLASAEFFTVKVVGNCMNPILRDGQRVRISDLPPKVGDLVAVFGSEEKLFVHRFILRRPSALRWPSVRSPINGSLVVTKPDEGSRFDPETPATNLLGTVVAIERVKPELDQPAEKGVGTADEVGNGGGSDVRFQPFKVRLGARLSGLAWGARYIIRRLLRIARRKMGLGQRRGYS